MNKRIRLVLTLLIATWLTSPATAGFVPVSNPGDAVPGGTYLSTTHLIPITASEFSTINSASDGTENVSFSTPLQVLQVPSSWDTWGAPPFTENPNPTVLYSQGLTQVTLTLSKSATTFGFELQPNALDIFSVTATFFNGATTLGSITRSVNGDSGARLFAAYVTTPTQPITSVRISTGGSDFAIAELRYQLPQATVPEPSGFAILAAGGLCSAGYQSLRRRWARGFPPMP